MPEGPITIRCPHCGYPYPMSKMQLDVYIGRSMGCMHCGKSFPVFAPPPPPPPRDELLAAGAEMVEARRQAAIAAGETAPPPVASSNKPSVPHTQPEPPSLLGVVAMAAAVVFVLLAAVAAVVGFSGSSDNAIKAVSRSQTPMTLLRLGFGFAAAGMILGVIALVRTKGKQRELGRQVRFGIAAPGTVVCLMELILASLLALMVLPGLNRGLAEAHRAARQANLQTIGYALIASASEQVDGKFPDSLGALVATGGIQPDSVVCPAGEHPPAPSDLSNNEKAKLIADGKHVGYTYLGKGLAMRATGGKRVSTHTVLAYESAGRHGDPDSFHVLFADGAVVFTTKERATKLLAELVSGQNPPPSADAIKP